MRANCCAAGVRFSGIRARGFAETGNINAVSAEAGDSTAGNDLGEAGHRACFHGVGDPPFPIAFTS